MFFIDPNIQMWFVFSTVIFALVFYTWEKISLELTSLLVISSLLVFFHLFPALTHEGRNVLDANHLLKGFANPALVAVISLLIIGQALVQTGALENTANLLVRIGTNWPIFAISISLVSVIILSGFLNNTPVVVIFIPIMQVLASKFSKSTSQLMMPLSYAAILGGSLTIIGSSTNLLVSTTLQQLDQAPLRFFEFTIPGLILAGVGFFYVLFIAPRILPDRASLASSFMKGSGKQFIAQITVTKDSEWVGKRAISGFFPGTEGMTIFMVLKGEHAEVPPFDDVEITIGDILVVAATRSVLTDVLKKNSGLVMVEQQEKLSQEAQEEREEKFAEDQMLAEVMIAPSSRMVGLSLEQIGFQRRFKCIVLGIQRRSRMIRSKVTEIRLESGDVLLIQGSRNDIQALRSNQDIILLEWSAEYVPSTHHARRAGVIFSLVVGTAALGILPISIASLMGAACMIATGALNIRQATRAIDRRIILLIATSIALSLSLQETGGARYIANIMVSLVGNLPPEWILSVLFISIALATNILSNNACAVLFTPIAVEIAHLLDLSIIPFAVTVVLAANCSFASPIGYHTNLLVMGPGHYKFVDYMKAGIPLTIIIWVTFSIMMPWYYSF